MSLANLLPAPQYKLLFNHTLSVDTVLRIYFHKESNAIVIQNSGFIIGEEVKVFLHKCETYLVEKRTDKILVDFTYRKGYCKADQAWVDEEWIPKLIQEKKLAYVAYVGSQDFLLQLVVEKSAFKMSSQIQIKPFTSLDEGVTWLKEQ